MNATFVWIVEAVAKDGKKLWLQVFDTNLEARECAAQAHRNGVMAYSWEMNTANKSKGKSQ